MNRILTTALFLVTLEWDIDGAIVTIAGESVLAEAVPERALAGRVTAQENRAKPVQ